MAALRIAFCLATVAGTPAAARELPTPSPTAEQAHVRRLIEEVEKHSAGTDSLSASFVQEKHLALLAQPLVLRGRLHMQRPDLFAFHVESPLRYSMVISAKELRQWDEDTKEVQTISLAENPGFELVLRQMRGWLSGSYSPMLREYDASVLAVDPLELEFSPLEGALAHGTVERVRVAFDRDGRRIREIDILDRQGDRTVFRFAEIEINTKIDSSAWEVEPSGE